MPWSSGLVHWICVLMAESSERGFESWPQPWCLCPSASHFTIIASLHPGVNGYLWGQSWLLCLINPICAEMAAIELYTPPGSWGGFSNDLCTWWAGGNNVQCLDLVARNVRFIRIVYYYYLLEHFYRIQNHHTQCREPALSKTAHRQNVFNIVLGRRVSVPTGSTTAGLHEYTL